ncbi:MAG TPA: NAD-dependent epimerase/dehydratase family protein [Pyrinomonadaceae bacterium]|nr:NAD-dependent epimerase/dehydratase family protein [Pyrinomonadaceae bacterium]
MRILFTGASSPLAAGVLQQLLVDNDVELWCGRHRKEIPLVDPTLHVIDLDLESDVRAALLHQHFDLVVHFAGVTHEANEERYWKVNRDGTMRLAQAVRENGCRRFVYVSTRCATPGSGAYGESKLAAEAELRKLDWDSLLIVRPAEIYGSDVNEGIDRMLALARRWRVVPALFGHANLSFAPLHVDDFCKLAAELIRKDEQGVRIENLCGPEDLSGMALANRIGRRYRALPLPLWWPVFNIGLRALQMLGFSVVKRDQLTRLVSEKTGTTASAKARAGMRRFLAE